MYVPDQFRWDDVGEQHALMRAHPFAVLITSGGSGLEVTHLPTVIKTEGSLGVVECHLARANPHWRAIMAEPRGLLIYTGPHAYITPNWYPSKAADGKVVPTWNYAVVHAHGTVEVIDDRDWLLRHVADLTDQEEAGSPAPWATADAPTNYLMLMSRGIVGVRFTIDRLEGKAKMSQNREPVDRAGVVAGLTARAEGADDAVAGHVTRAMKAAQP